MPNEKDLTIRVKVIAENETAKAVFAAASGSPALTWTAKEPKRRGWWWFRSSPECRPVVVEVRELDNGTMTAFMPWGRVFLYRTTSSEAEWAGPLVEPLDAPETRTPENDGADRLSEAKPRIRPEP